MTSRRIRPLVIGAAAVLLLASCSSSGSDSADDARTTTTTDTAAGTTGTSAATDLSSVDSPPDTADAPSLDEACAGRERRVLVIGMDGVRSDSLETASTPVIDSLIADGAVAWDAYVGGDLGTETEQSTVSGPGWASILTGVWANKHLLTSNEFGETDLATYPHLFVRIREQLPDAELASIVQWIPINLLVPDEIDAYERVGDGAKVASFAVDRLTTADPTVMFLHFDDPDAAGHQFGFTSEAPEYLASIEGVDTFAGEVLDAVEARPTRADECWLTIVTTDHGGDGENGHGAQTPQERTVPLVVSGDGIATTTDSTGPGVVVVPPTIMAYLGLDVDPEWGWDGQPFGL